VNNAGVEVTLAVTDTTFEQIDTVIRTNLSAPIWLIKLVLPGMLAQRRGTIVTVSSMAGKSVSPYNAVYSATKHGVNGFTASLNIELEGTGVRAGVVCPGFVSSAGMWADTGEKAPRMMREVSPGKVAASVLKVIDGSNEALVTPAPMRPLLAAAELAPGLTKVVVKRMGIVRAFKDRAERAALQGGGGVTAAKERETADAR
jgi:short-subunit dehydrogenase